MKTKSNLKQRDTNSVSTPYQLRIKSVPKDRSKQETDIPVTSRKYSIRLDATILENNAK